MPGIPYYSRNNPLDRADGLAYDETPRGLTFWDLCRKESMTSWGDDEHWHRSCLSDDAYCGIKDWYSLRRCNRSGRWPLDFIYERRENKYNFDKYDTDEKIVTKIRTGKGDETFIFDGDGNNIFVEIMFGGTTPRRPEQDYLKGDNNLISARACRFQMNVEDQYTEQGYEKRAWTWPYLNWLFA